MSRPTRPPHEGAVTNTKFFRVARQNLVNNGLQHFTTQVDTPFTAETHIDTKGQHAGTTPY